MILSVCCFWWNLITLMLSPIIFVLLFVFYPILLLIEGDMYFNLIDLSGRSVFTYEMGKSVVGKNNEKIVLPEDLKNGMYVVNMFVNNNVMEKKIVIQK